MLHVAKLDGVPVTYVAIGQVAHDQEHALDLAGFRAALHADQRLGRKTAIILDLRRSSELTTSQRWMVASWMKEVAPLFEKTTFGTVFIVESALVLGVLSALLWVQPKGTPYTIVRDLEAAVSWTLECLSEAKVSLPTDARKDLEAALQAPLAEINAKT